MFDADRSGEVDFTEFISGMAQFSTQADIEAKLRFAFRIYDFDNDGYISNSDLFQVNLPLYQRFHFPNQLHIFLITLYSGLTSYGG